MSTAQSLASSKNKPVRYLTGITTSGTPHLGNYVGSIRPAIRACSQPNTEQFYFLADYHALIKTNDPQRVARSTLEIAACWLACGLDPQTVYFYRQSDIAGIPQLCWYLTCVTGKGMLNRAHAYKAQVDKNLIAGLDPDQDVTAGLYMYPVLMTADILIFNAHKVPVGRDQIQHIEMARDIAASFNHRYGHPYFTQPEAVFDEQVATLVGLDGRKMSKSYDNTIALFCPPAELKKQILSIVTDSKAAHEAKDTDGSVIFQIYQAFASPSDTLTMRDAFKKGISWKDAKEKLRQCIEAEVAPMREKYQELMAHPEQIEEILQLGAQKAGSLSDQFIKTLRPVVGIAPIRGCASLKQAEKKSEEKQTWQFKQYKEADGCFYFKVLDSKNKLHFQSNAYPTPKEAAAGLAKFKTTMPLEN